MTTVAVAVTAVAGAAWAQAQAQTTGLWLARNPKVQFTQLRVAGGQATLEYPRRDWDAAAPLGTTVAIAVEKDGRAWITLERTQMQTALAPEEVTDLFAQLESDRIKAADPEAAASATRLFAVNGRRFTGVQFTHRGAKGPEVVRLYSFPVGNELYRLTVGAEAGQFTKFEPIFAHVASTFTVTAPAAAPAAPATTPQ
jgi:hypothetical protein